MHYRAQDGSIPRLGNRIIHLSSDPVVFSPLEVKLHGLRLLDHHHKVVFEPQMFRPWSLPRGACYPKVQLALRKSWITHLLYSI